MSDDESGKTDWTSLAIGLAMIGGAIWLHGVFTDLETSGGSMRINWIIAGVYKLLGKWGVVGITALLGIFLCWKAFTGKTDETE